MKYKLTITEKIPIFFLLIIIAYCLLCLIPPALLLQKISFIYETPQNILLGVACLLCIPSVILYLRQKKEGWVLTFFSFIFFASMHLFLITGNNEIPFTISLASALLSLISWSLLLLIPILVLFFPSIRIKFNVNAKKYIFIPLVANLLIILIRFLL